MSLAAQSLKLVLPYLENGLKNRLGLLSPYRAEGGMPGELYGLLDLDEVGEDRELPQMSGRSAMRLAFEASGPLMFTTFLADSPDVGNDDTRTDARDRFIELHSHVIEQVPLIGMDIPDLHSPCLIRQVSVVQNRMTRVLSQPRNGGAGSNWTMHLLGEISVCYIVRRDVLTQKHQLTVSP